MSKHIRVSRTSNPALSSLKRENKKLKSDLKKAQKEIAYLRRVLKKQDTLSAIPQVGATSSYEAMLREGAIAHRRYASSTYGAYLYQSVRASSLGRWVKRVVTFFRRLRVVRIVLTILTFLLASAFFVTLIPLLFVALAVALLSVMLTAKSMNLQMQSTLSGKHIYVFIPQDDVTLDEDSFMANCAKDMAKHPNTAVLVVSPHLLSVKGLGGHGLYFTARRESQNLYLIRKSYFFILRRHVLRSVDPHATMIF